VIMATRDDDLFTMPRIPPLMPPSHAAASRD